LVLAIRLTTSSLRCARIPVALLALLNSDRRSASRSLRVWENRATPATAACSCGGVSAKVCARTVSELESWSVFSPLMVADRSPRASGS
jgi:hypothetical protein